VQNAIHSLIAEDEVYFFWQAVVCEEDEETQTGEFKKKTLPK
jgi:hypothetical protein